jgi:galactokinase
MARPVPATSSGAVLDPEVLRDELVRRVPEAGERPDDVRIARAPGRVNLIGEHTDYNDGLVLPAAIDLEIWIAYLPTSDRIVELTSLETGRSGRIDLDQIGGRRRRWIDYVSGTAWALAEAGQPTVGFRGVSASSLPVSAGLSSSAAFELVSAWALSGPDGPRVDGMTLARICQRAENQFVGVNSGLMDQFASSLGRRGSAMLLDCRSLEHEPVALPLDDHQLVVCHTGSSRRLEASQYNARRAQCEHAVRVLAEQGLPVRSLRDVTKAMLPDLRGRLDGESFRRAEHVVLENARVEATVEALRAGDLASVGWLWASSHASLRDLYEVSSPELDALVEIASGVDGVVAARMTGAGFGGCTVNLVRRDAVDRLTDAVEREYPARTGLTPHVYPVEPVNGAGFAP